MPAIHHGWLLDLNNALYFVHINYFYEEKIYNLSSTNMSRGGFVRRVVGKHLISLEQPAADEC